jgi:hypothetical protein
MFHLQSEPNPPYITPWSSLLSNESIYTTALLVTSILSVVEAVIMKSSALVTGVGLLLIARTVANKDAITLQTRGNSWINEAVATLVLPEVPDYVTGDIALWSAIMMNDYQGDFLQGVSSSSPACVQATSYPLLYCTVD